MSKFQKFIVPGRPARPKEYKDIPVGFEQLAVNTATGFASIPSNANKAIITVDDATMRYRDDGANPTADIGIKVYRGGTIILNSRESIVKFKAIKVGANNSELNVSYYSRE